VIARGNRVAADSGRLKGSPLDAYTLVSRGIVAISKSVKISRPSSKKRRCTANPMSNLAVHADIASSKVRAMIKQPAACEPFLCACNLATTGAAL